MAFVVVHRRKFAARMQRNVVGMRDGVFFSIGHSENEGEAFFDCGLDLSFGHAVMLLGWRGFRQGDFFVLIFLLNSEAAEGCFLILELVRTGRRLFLEGKDRVFRSWFWLRFGLGGFV